MDKSAIKSFAVEARRILMKSAETQAGLYGVSKDGCAEPIQKGAGFEVYRTAAGTDNRIFGDDIKRREKLVKAIEAKGFDQVIEETAYTWFNRLIAIRFMEVNGYLPTRTRVLSSETGSNTPDLVTEYLDVDLDMTAEELETVQSFIRDNKYDDAFAKLFIKQCNALHEILPGLFEKTADYMELLLKLSYTSDGVVRILIDTIPERNFDIEKEGQIEIIGWMYQFYNIEPKAAVFSKKSGKITKEEIPAATQLFTPEWIVKYMVENSLGRLWVDHLIGNGNRMHNVPDGQKVKSMNEWDNDVESIKKNWKYYLDEAEQEEQVEEELWNIRFDASNKELTNIKVIDPCMGSGHILVYCFEVLMQIYESQGYTQRDAVQSILENNLFGLDIDKRAAQLSYFALMMKARQYDRRIFSRGIQPNVMAIKNSVRLSQDHMNRLGDEKEIVQKMINDFRDAEEYGSILNVEYSEKELDAVLKRLETIDEMSSYGNLVDMIESDEVIFSVLPMLDQAKIMSQKYDVVITNPPYMSVSAAGGKLNEYVKKNYPDSKTDLFAVFIEKCRDLLIGNGYQAMITMHAWMFLGSFEKLRKKQLYYNVVNMAHLGARAFEEIGGEIVQTTSFIFRKSLINDYKGVYCRLLDSTTQTGKEEMFLSGDNRYVVNQNDFFEIPGAPFAYWISERLTHAFSEKLLGDYAYTKQGFATGNNEIFLRFWFELNDQNTALNLLPRNEAMKSAYKWFPCNKGGSFRKWYGNNIYVANWENNGKQMTEFSGSVIRNPQFYFLEGITWSSLANQLSLRYSPEGFLFESKGSMCYTKGMLNIRYLLGLLNSKVTSEALSVLSPTLDFHEGPMAKVPVIVCDKDTDNILELTGNCIELSRYDWDSFETSWDFKEHPLVRYSKGLWDVTAIGAAMHYYYNEHPVVSCPFELCFMLWQGECNERFNQLKMNEEELNRIFINIYGLQDELTPEIEDKDVTVRQADIGRDIRSFLSYAVGCMFGRYSLDVEGLAYAGGEWDDSKYSTFIPDPDNCIPITDEEYFEDDIVARFCDWMKKVFGDKSLESNLDFIAKTLGNKGTTSREVIRNYFLNDFIKDHIKIYQKRPIYWLFDSGKQNGFKALVYMHRYDRDTVGRIRSDYLRKAQDAIEAAQKNAKYTIENTSSAVDRASAEKKYQKYAKQLNEIRMYYPALAHMALQRIDIDLDDGVKVNYEKFQNIEVVDENGKKQKINLLTKI